MALLAGMIAFHGQRMSHHLRRVCLAPTLLQPACPVLC